MMRIVKPLLLALGFLAVSACSDSFKETTLPSPAIAERFAADSRIFAGLAGYMGERRDDGEARGFGEAPRLVDGDVVTVLRADARSLLVAFMTMGGWSHVGIVLREGGETWVLDCAPENCAGGKGVCVRRHRLKDWLRDGVQAAAFRPVRAPEAGRAREVLRRLERGCASFDWSFTLDNDADGCLNLYCSEFVYVALREMLGRPTGAFFCDDIAMAAAHKLFWRRNSPGRGGTMARLAVAEGEKLGLAPPIPSKVLPPSFPDLSPDFRPVWHAVRPDAREMVGPGLEPYARLRPAILFLKALDGEPATLFLDQAMDRAGLDAAARKTVAKEVGAFRRSGKAVFDGSELALSCLVDAAQGEMPYPLYDAALGRVAPAPTSPLP